MTRLIAAAAFVLLAGGVAWGQEAATPEPPPLKLPAHAQPSQREIEALPASDRSRLSVDLSQRSQDQVEKLYRQLIPETAPRRARTSGSGE